jgi:lycopene cyclase domain-containing protein
MPEYTVLAVLGVVAVVAYELRIARTGVFTLRSFWIALAICYGFMFAVNGWLTKLSAPIVRYDTEQITGVRVPWDIPIEDYAFGFAMLTLVIVSWERARRREAGRVPVGDGASR